MSGNSPDVLLIRADADSVIGTGHVMRCLALAQYWIDSGGQAVFCCIEIPDQLKQRLLDEKIDVVITQGLQGSRDDAQRTLELAAKVNCLAVVADGYRFGSEYQQTIKSSGIRLLVFDDYRHADYYHADIILNQNISADEQAYRDLHDHALLLLGTRYSLLRREFRLLSSDPVAPSDTVERILITMGGGDSGNLSGKIIEALKIDEFAHLKKTVVAGAANEHLAELQKRADRTFNVLHNPSDFPRIMKDSNLAISAAGSTCWELAYFGVPALLYVVAENQNAIGRALHQSGYVVNLGNADEFDPDTLVAELRKLIENSALRKRMSDKGRELVDGHGVSRVCEAIRKL